MGKLLAAAILAAVIACPASLLQAKSWVSPPGCGGATRAISPGCTGGGPVPHDLLLYDVDGTGNIYAIDATGDLYQTQ